MTVAAQVHFEPNLFALAPGYTEQTAELNHLATFCLQVLGARKVLVARTICVISFLKPHGTPSPTLKDVYKFMKEATSDQAKEFLVKAAIFQCIGRAGDVVYLPAGVVMSEAPHERDPCVGCRIQSLCLKDLGALEAVGKALESMGKSHEFLDLVKAKLLLATP